jgi:hypothetical protein
MWEWILAVVLIIFLYLFFVRPNLTESPGCKACAKRNENPVD